jgi:hypothetical protein
VLLDYGADPNAKDNDQLTALHTAARAGLAQNCQFLLEHTKGRYGNEVDAQGQSALHHAVSCDGVECVAYLLSTGLAANQADLEMRTYVQNSRMHVYYMYTACTCTCIFFLCAGEFEHISCVGNLPRVLTHGFNYLITHFLN